MEQNSTLIRINSAALCNNLNNQGFSLGNQGYILNKYYKNKIIII